MYTTKVTNFPESSASKAFANVRITVGGDKHITTTMSNHGSEVTIFFESTADIRQLASNLLTQASTKENQ
tara:strand:+ start:975 stop:1184 length:210 start_codon:yes stop_codon:yes gene_type:complete